MKVYIKQTAETSLFEQARIGFIKMGHEVEYFTEVPENISKEDILVGWIGDVFKALDVLGMPRPLSLDYPKELSHYIGRKIEKCHINEIVNNPEMWPIFIKPTEHKLFTGRVIKEFKDLIGIVDCEVYYCDPMEILSEWRVYVIEGKICGIKNYKNKTENEIYSISKKFAEEIISKYTSQPKSYCIDIGINSVGQQFIIEVNDGFSCGNYGLDEVTYAKLLMTRWRELVKIAE